MKTFDLKREIVLPISIEEAWEFFSNPANLSDITPPEMGFDILSEPPAKMYAGMIIRYNVKPMLGLPTLWVSEITHVNTPNFFVDEQKVGPYKLWHHQHRFKEVPGGTRIEDEVNFALPMGRLGIFAYQLFVKKKLNQIFDYREYRLKQLFGYNHSRNVA